MSRGGAESKALSPNITPVAASGQEGRLEVSGLFCVVGIDAQIQTGGVNKSLDLSCLGTKPHSMSAGQSPRGIFSLILTCKYFFPLLFQRAERKEGGRDRERETLM